MWNENHPYDDAMREVENSVGYRSPIICIHFEKINTNLNKEVITNYFQKFEKLTDVQIDHLIMCQYCIDNIIAIFCI